MLSKFLNLSFARPYLQQLLSSSESGGSLYLVSLSIRDVLLRDSWAVVYQVTISDHRGVQIPTPFLVVHHFPNGGFGRAVSRLRRQRQSVAISDQEAGLLFLEQPEHNLLIYGFPLDPRMSHLPEVASPSLVRNHLLSAEKELVRAFALQDGCYVEPLRYVPTRRCQLLYTLCGQQNGDFSILGKTFHSESRAQRLFDSMKKVAGLFDCNGEKELLVPSALEYLPRLKMVIQEKVPGSTLYELLCRGEAEDRHFTSAARSLAVLHAGPLALEEKFLPVNEVNLVTTSYRRLVSVTYEGTAYVPVLERLQQQAQELLPCLLVPVHRDFYDKQLLVHEGQTAMIDLDSLTLGFAEIDLGNFMAHLQLRALQGKICQEKASRWQHRFLEEYACRTAQRVAPKGLKFFLASTYFRLACKYRLRPDGTYLASRLLNEAMSALNVPAKHHAGVRRSIQPSEVLT